MRVGDDVGDSLGLVDEGALLWLTLGDLDGEMVGISLGESDGDVLGLCDGETVGLCEGDKLGLCDGDADGLTLGELDGETLGDAEGPVLGLSDGLAPGDAIRLVGAGLGNDDGRGVGTLVAPSWYHTSSSVTPKFQLADVVPQKSYRH